jgi:hypothetical protein
MRTSPDNKRPRTPMAWARRALDLAEQCIDGEEYVNAQILLRAAGSYLSEVKSYKATGSTLNRLYRRRNRVQTDLENKVWR